MKQLIQLPYMHSHEHNTTGSRSMAHTAGIVSPFITPPKL